VRQNFIQISIWVQRLGFLTFDFMFFRRGPEVSRLYRVLEHKKTEEMASKHIIANRQMNQAGNYCVLILEGVLLGMLYKTICRVIESFGSLPNPEGIVQVLFQADKKLEFKLEPGLFINLYPPWQEYAHSIPLILCNAFEIETTRAPISEPIQIPAKHSIFTPKRLALVSEFSRTLPRKIGMNSDPGDIIPMEIEDFKPDLPSRSGDILGLIEPDCSWAGIVQRVFSRIYRLPEESEEATLSAWFNGFRLDDDTTAERIVRQRNPSFLLELIHPEQFGWLEVEIPRSLWATCLDQCLDLESKRIQISNLNMISASHSFPEESFVQQFTSGAKGKYFRALLKSHSNIEILDESSTEQIPMAYQPEHLSSIDQILQASDTCRVSCVGNLISFQRTESSSSQFPSYWFNIYDASVTNPTVVNKFVNFFSIYEFELSSNWIFVVFLVFVFRFWM
jgi:hypothetical protein